MQEKYKDYLGLGIAGNFALHLAQAGELEEFKDIITAEEAAPKGIFPFYLPSYCATQENYQVPKETLSIYPLSSNTIELPKENVNVQMEPELALLCDIKYKNSKVLSITPTHFAAYNDCSIRVAGAEKISDKKNWGSNSKGIASSPIKIPSFKENTLLERYSICSFLKRDNTITAYGEDVQLNGYSYFYEKLENWICKQINDQENFGPLEPLLEYIQACNYPSQSIISIGATRYTPYGERTFLQKGDEIFVVVYNRSIYSLQNILSILKNEDSEQKEMSLLHQKVL